MLTRLEVNGFKNLFGIVVDLGPYTCIAGPNAVGKSNLFDAIEFLSHLASSSFVEAAQQIRLSGEKSIDPTLLFFRHEDGTYEPMRIAAEMIVDPDAHDDFGQHVAASSTYLRYELELRIDVVLGPSGAPVERIRLTHESLIPLTATHAKARLAWTRAHDVGLIGALVRGRRRNPFISMGEDSSDSSVVKIHTEGTQGRARMVSVVSTQRTVVSTTNTAERPTILAARREMENWKKLALEPSAMRTPDDVSEQGGVGSDGSHLAVALSRLLETDDDAAAEVRATATSLTDVSEVRADVDHERRIVTLSARLGKGPLLPARVLSEGTLRFLALAIIQLDPEFGRVICMEEPENGIHPAKIPDMVELLHDLAFDVDLPPGEDNVLRQVIVNTHSPHFVAEHEDSEILVAVHASRRVAETTVDSFALAPVAETWRARVTDDAHGRTGGYTVPRNTIDSYLSIRPDAPQVHSGGAK